MAPGPFSFSHLCAECQNPICSHHLFHDYKPFVIQLLSLQEIKLIVGFAHIYKEPGDEEFRKAWKKEMDEKTCLWTGREDESDAEEGRSRLEDEIKKVKQKAKEHSDLIDADDSNELRSVWSGSDEEKTLWTGSEGDDDDDDIPTEAHPNESSDAYIDKLFEYEEAPKYRMISELLKAEKELEELSP